MKLIRPLILGVTFYLFIYASLPVFGVTFGPMFLLFTIGSGLLIYMVYAVMKYGEAPAETWEEGYWYSDVDKRYLADDETDLFG